MHQKILVRFGDMMLKGRNIGQFIKRIHAHVHFKLKDLDIAVDARHDRMLIDVKPGLEQLIIARLSQVPGVFSYSLVYVARPELDHIVEVSAMVMDREIGRDGLTFKIETKRIDKHFPLTSQDITKTVAGRILTTAKRRVVVDVKTPEQTLYIEIHKTEALIYLTSIPGMGGFPAGVAGRGLVMLSGGIDSSVAAYLAIKQGVDVELFHFESTPLTAIESVQKVIDLSKKLAIYMPQERITLHLVPFTHLHEALLEHIPKPYLITVMRRMMYRLGERFIKAHKMLCLINGESIGQVASQTLQSMKAVEVVTSFPVIRPLATMDKHDIIALARQIDTFAISTRPYEDCCSVYVPRSPATKPMHIYALKYEELFDYEPMLMQALNAVWTLDITPRTIFDVSRFGLTTKEARRALEGTEENHDHLDSEQIV